MNLTKKEVQQVLDHLLATSGHTDSFGYLVCCGINPDLYQHRDDCGHMKAITLLQSKLAEPDAEPVAWMRPSKEGYDSAFRDASTVALCRSTERGGWSHWDEWVPLFTHPAKQVPMTDAEIRRIQARHPTENDPLLFARAIEARCNT